MTRPTPCPSPWTKCSPNPAAAMTSRAAASTSRVATPGASAARPAAAASATRSCRSRCQSSGDPDDHGAGHVRVVAVDERAEVHGQQVAVGQGRVGGPVVRDRGVGARGDDGVERRALGARLAHPLLEVAGHLPLGAPGLQAAGGDHPGERGVRRRRRPGAVRRPRPRPSPRAASRPGPGPDAARRASAPRVSSAWPSTVTWALSKPTAPCSPSAPRSTARAQARVDEDAQVGRLVRGLLGVAAVGGEHGPVLAPVGVVAGVHQHRGVRAREAGQVADVDQIGDEQGVEIRPAQQVTQRVAAPGVPARRPFGTGRARTPVSPGEDEVRAGLVRCPCALSACSSPHAAVRLHPWVLRTLVLTVVYGIAAGAVRGPAVLGPGPVEPVEHRAAPGRRRRGDRLGGRRGRPRPAPAGVDVVHRGARRRAGGGAAELDPARAVRRRHRRRRPPGRAGRARLVHRAAHPRRGRSSARAWAGSRCAATARAPTTRRSTPTTTRSRARPRLDAPRPLRRPPLRATTARRPRPARRPGSASRPRAARRPDRPSPGVRTPGRRSPERVPAAAGPELAERDRMPEAPRLAGAASGVDGAHDRPPRRAGLRRRSGPRRARLPASAPRPTHPSRSSRRSSRSCPPSRCRAARSTTPAASRPSPGTRSPRRSSRSRRKFGLRRPRS